MKNEILFRCSALGKIVTGASLTPIPLTEKQELRLKELGEKGSKSKELIDLQKKKIEIPKAILSDGAKTYIQAMWYGENYEFQKTFHNKFTEKGNIKEYPSIKSLGQFLGFMTNKNEEHLKNEWIKGTPDIRLNTPKVTIDTKNVYYPDGLSFFNDKLINDYTWQIHGYNFLDEKEDGFIAKILMNPPEDILEKEVWNHWKSAGKTGPPNEEFYNEIRYYFDFEGKKPIDERVNLFHVKTTQNEIDIIKKWCEMAREYWHELDNEFTRRNKNEIDIFNNLKKITK